MLAIDETPAGEGRAGAGVRVRPRGRGLAEVIENPILNSPYREPTRQRTQEHPRQRVQGGTRR